MTKLAQDVMTANPACCSPKTSLDQVARLMVQHDCGEIPVIDSAEHIVGVVTDRDIVCRVVAEGKNPIGYPAESCMSELVVTVPWNAPLRDVLATMEKHQVRRVPVVDGKGGLVFMSPGGLGWLGGGGGGLGVVGGGFSGQWPVFPVKKTGGRLNRRAPSCGANGASVALEVAGRFRDGTTRSVGLQRANGTVAPREAEQEGPCARAAAVRPESCIDARYGTGPRTAGQATGNSGKPRHHHVRADDSREGGDDGKARAPV